MFAIITAPFLHGSSTDASSNQNDSPLIAISLSYTEAVWLITIGCRCISWRYQQSGVCQFALINLFPVSPRRRPQISQALLINQPRLSGTMNLSTEHLSTVIQRAYHLFTCIITKCSAEARSRPPEHSSQGLSRSLPGKRATASLTFTMHKPEAVVVVCWLLNVPATCECISGTDLLRQFYVLPH